MTNKYNPPPSFADGTIPLSVDGIQSQIRLARQESDRQCYPILKANERLLDTLTLELCADERRQGKRLEDWLLRAEAAAMARLGVDT
jgi:hypothetical protein